MTTNGSTAPNLSSTRAVALYVGALLGPSLLLLPGLASAIAGPASILAWIGLLAVSGLLAVVFSALGTRLPRGGGIAAYVTGGLGPRAGRAASWCFLIGVVLGAPVVCLIGGSYVGELVGGGRAVSVVAATGLLAVVVGLTLGGARATTAAQLVLVGLLVALIVVAVAGSASSTRASNWAPFAPHGWIAVGRASASLMLAFVGWEAIAPLTAQLADPRRQLPRIIGSAFAITAVVYLVLAGATIAVLGSRVDSAVPLAALLRVAVGSGGPLVAAVAAVALTLAATNAYIAGATALAAELRSRTRRRERASDPAQLQLGIAAVGAVVLVLVATGAVTTAELVTLPTTLFVTVYLACTVSAARILRGRSRVAAAVSAAAVAVVLAFSGWALLLAGVVVVVAAARDRNGVDATVRE